ncbi:FkbM family methyltransferase [Brumimicrobium sp.]|uniref:FkbM family methyltransferase n=1 Tax=Brumimicrobium sp. TaxID=2029867 RepID=UPI003A94AE9B
MTWKEFKLKIKKRWHYFLAKRESIETYYMTVVDSTKEITTFNYYGHIFHARLKNSSDYDMVNQVIVKGEYALAVSYFKAQSFEPKVLIDAGSNIGSTAIYLKHLFPETQIFCIEPDEENFDLLKNNLSKYVNNGSVKLYQAGLMGKSGLNLSINTNFRDKSSCARQVVVEQKENRLKSITIIDLIKEHNLQSIDLLKIDIEGAEVFLIKNDSNVSFLSITKCIAIEIHDEYECREKIYELLIKNNFVLLEDNETTLAINKSLA